MMQTVVNFFVVGVLLFSTGTVWSQGQTGQDYSIRNGIRVQLTPARDTMLSSEIAGRIASIAVREGESFREGQTLLELDCSLHQARLDKAVAQAAEARQVLTVNQQLDRLGSISVLEVGVASARLSAAEADSTLMREIVERCVIKAPYDGKVSMLQVRTHQYIAEGQELMAILDDSRLDIEMNVPSRWLPSLSAGQSFLLRLDETGGSYPARIDRIGAAIDPVSQTVKIYGRLDGKFDELLSGMSGVAEFDAATASN